MLKLLGTTRLERSLQQFHDSEFDEGLNPAIMLEFQGHVSDADLLVEWAARTCYRSNPSFQSNPVFVKKVVERGHLDVMEHASVIVEFQMKEKQAFEFIAKTRIGCPYLYMGNIEYCHDDLRFVAYGNLRAWYDFINASYYDTTITYLTSAEYHALLQILQNVSPLIFGQPMIEIRLPELNDVGLVQVSTERILLARTASYKNFDEFEMGSYYVQDPRQATFQLSSVSRAFTHQHVRHRVLSHSQESQRYVGMENEDIPFVMPKNISGEARTYLENYLAHTSNAYNSLRTAGAKKEDARVVLPNCTATKIISSGFMGGWKHYFDLRMAKDAQLEIREVAEDMYSLLEATGIKL